MSGPSYDDIYGEFDSPLQRQIRREAYGEDIGQHSWVTAAELREVISLLRLSSASRLLDLGCGPCGPLSYIVSRAGCQGIGCDVNASALKAARVRATSPLTSSCIADLNGPLPFGDGAFHAVISLDVILHLRDRALFLREIARVLASGGRLLFTDAGVVTGALSDEEIRHRSIHGFTQLRQPGFNERALEQAGFQLLESRDQTASLLKNASGRLLARRAHRAELELLEGSAGFERQQRYLETVIGLSERGALSRMMYLSHLAA